MRTAAVRSGTVRTRGVRSRAVSTWPGAVGRLGAVAAAYLTARFIADVVAAGVGGAHAFDMAGEAIASLVVGATLMVLSGRLGGTQAQQGSMLAVLLFAGTAAVMIEGSAFAPSLSPVGRLPVGLLLQLGVSGTTAGVAVLVSSRREVAAIPPFPSVAAYARGVAGGAVTYVIAYLVTGALMYLAVTGPYYESHDGGLETPAPAIVIVVAVLEGLLMALAAAPIARALPGSTRSRGLVCGLALWALGGVAPLLQVSRLPDVIRAASAVEILVQKVPVGIVIARRFRR